MSQVMLTNYKPKTTKFWRHSKLTVITTLYMFNKTEMALVMKQLVASIQLENAKLFQQTFCVMYYMRHILALFTNCKTQIKIVFANDIEIKFE